ncbi:DUF4126 domain-containing protein [Leptolyngbya sp. FACHB-16]|nr:MULTISPECIES: DUF4126 domain-containing protein [unclassified Leptolyngbya]MBD1909479.1 DUF4126 domain-containing protein [Leptolyngbya sp. FACHB-8]MBD2153356.1 DUF4126 domain-containing protein [Leptolyngbya sp. FACHB-16]
MLGISLSAAAGFRVFVPLLMLSAASVLGHVPIPDDFQWVESDQALVLFAIASAIEVGGYYIPWFDHILELGALPLAMLAGTLITASAAPDTMNPLAQWIFALLVGGGAAGITRGGNWIIRILLTATSAGLANPVLATIELGLAIALTLLALTVPVLAGILVIVGWIVFVRQTRRFLGRWLNPNPVPPSDAAT